MTPSVCKISEIADEERISIGRALGLNLQPQTQWLKETYGLEGGNLFEVLQGSDVYGGHGVNAPKTMTHRYLTEDVTYGRCALPSRTGCLLRTGFGYPLSRYREHHSPGG